MGKEVEIENYISTPVGDALLRELERYLIPIKIDEAQNGDILVFSVGWNGVPRHVGIKTDIGMIHADERSKKIVETGYYPRLLVGAYKYV